MLVEMASTVSNGLRKAVDSATSQKSKLADSLKDTKDSQDSNAKLTTDWGSNVSDTDHWLTVSTEDQYPRRYWRTLMHERRSAMLCSNISEFTNPQ